MSQAQKPYFTTLRIVHAALLLGMIAFFLFIRFMVLSSDQIDNSTVTDMFLLYLPPILLGVGILSGWLVFKNRLKETEGKMLSEKLMDYRAALIIRWALVEAAVLFALCMFLIYADRYFMGVALVGMAAFTFLRPDPRKAVTHLKLNEEDAAAIQDRNFTV
jgi:hypothetical protein